jgi:hypothetical protein
VGHQRFGVRLGCVCWAADGGHRRFGVRLGGQGPGVGTDELEQITSELKSHEEAIGELEARHDPALEARIEELREQRVELIARLGALGASGANGDA